tara:strand:- start:14 stop:1951 length:1938 start_codon:yes stop_codon:yes gene_type:complete
LIFENEYSEEAKEIYKIDTSHKSGDYWHIEIKGLEEGCFYGYKVFKESLDKEIFSTNLLLDPCSRAIGGWGKFSRKNDSPFKNALKSIVCERDSFDFKKYPRPKHSWQNTIIYELHVGAFTQELQDSVSKDANGSFLDLIQKIPYLKSLGITSIELLPVFAFDSNDAPLGRKNFWGYSPINWFTPHIDFSKDKNPLKVRNEFRELVKTCHLNNIEVILDVVFNHTTEGNELGPIISWKGFDKNLYYHIGKKNEFLDVTGCGNTIAAHKPHVRNLIIESLHCWANELGVDGFRFDLGIALTRGENLNPLENPALFEAIETDPKLAEIKIISEPWDCGGLYKLGDFPAKNIGTWNGHFRDEVRKFWKGDKNIVWHLSDKLIGSPKIYKPGDNRNLKSINFITAHDGFTLNDLVSYNQKHNFANGENNKDGENHNNSWNHGIEGPTRDPQLKKLRKQQQRNFLTTLFISKGIPMLSMGDEISRTQGGNNNPWCQNSPLNWMPWSESKWDKEMLEFTKALIHIRKKYIFLFNPNIHLSQSNDIDSVGEAMHWYQWHGTKPCRPDWSGWSHTLSFSINSGNHGSILWVAMNAFSQGITFEIPKCKSKWVKLIDTSSSKIDIKNTTENKDNIIDIKSKSIVLMIAKDLESQ